MFAVHVLDELLLKNKLVMIDNFCDEIKSALKTECELIFFDEIDSTNNYAKSLVHDAAGHATSDVGIDAASDVNNDAAGGFVFVADSQTAGRGRLGKSFVSPPGCGIYLSVLMKAPRKDDALPYITMGTAVAVRRAIENVTHENASIKWVNDLYLREKKVCGILVEGVSGATSADANGAADVSGAAGSDVRGASDASGAADATCLNRAAIDYVVIGVGVNCFATDLPDEIKEIAGPISEEPGVFSRGALAAAIIDEIFVVMNQMRDDEKMRAIIDEYRTHCITPELVPSI